MLRPLAHHLPRARKISGKRRRGRGISSSSSNRRKGIREVMAWKKKRRPLQCSEGWMATMHYAQVMMANRAGLGLAWKEGRGGGGSKYTKSH